MELLRAMGRGLDETVEVSTESLADYAVRTLDAKSLEETLKQGRRLRPDLQAQEERVSQAEALHSASVWDGLPALVLYGDYGPNGTRLDNSINTYTAGVGLRLPFFTSGRLSSMREASRSGLEKAKVELADMRAQVELEIRQAWKSQALAEQRVKAAREALESSAEEYRQAERSYLAGAAGNLEAVDAHSRLSDAEHRFAEAVFSYGKAHIDLWFSQGVLLERLQLQ